MMDLNVTQDVIDSLDERLALEELAQLTDEEQAAVAAWSRAVHLRWHMDTRGIYACCLFNGTTAAEELANLERAWS